MNRSLLEPRKLILPMLPGFKVHDLKKNVDERGFFAEIYRHFEGVLRSSSSESLCPQLLV